MMQLKIYKRKQELLKRNKLLKENLKLRDQLLKCLKIKIKEFFLNNHINDIIILFQ